MSPVDGMGAILCAEVVVETVWGDDIGSPDPGETATIIITVTVDPSTPDGTVLTNPRQARVAGRN